MYRKKIKYTVGKQLVQSTNSIMEKLQHIMTEFFKNNLLENKVATYTIRPSAKKNLENF